MTNTMTSVMTGLPLPSQFLRAFRDAMERLADGSLAPALDLYTTPDAIVAKVALPGVKREDVDITVGDDLVTIRGSVNEEKETTDAGYVHKELSHGLFSRSFWLPAGVNTEAARASLKGRLAHAHPREDRGGQADARQAPCRLRPSRRDPLNRTRGGGPALGVIPKHVVDR
jgi:HSP20 family molecular chaperone IbpA